MILAVYYCKKKTRCMSVPLYPDRESNSELSFRRALLYPFNYQGAQKRLQRYKRVGSYGAENTCF